MLDEEGESQSFFHLSFSFLSVQSLTREEEEEYQTIYFSYWLICIALGQ